MKFATILVVVNHLPEDGQCRPKPRISYIYKNIVFLLCAVGINIVNGFGGRNMDILNLRVFLLQFMCYLTAYNS